MKNTSRRSGFSKRIVVLALFLITVGCFYFFSYHSSHSAAEVAHKVAIAKHLAQVNKANQLEEAWKQAVAVSPPDGNVDIAVYDNATGAIAHYTNVPGNSADTFITASIIKLSILESTLWQDQQQGLPGLTQDQLSESEPMIENSDNNSADDLYLDAGGSSGLNAYFKQIGATDTIASGPWGLTRTTAIDQLKIVGEVAYPGKLLTTASAKQANGLMDQIESDQRWGVSSGVPDAVSVQLKDGWLSNSDIDGSSGWNVNSVGHVHGDGVDYTIAVLTNEDNSLQDGINTIQMLSTTTWDTLSK